MKFAKVARFLIETFGLFLLGATMLVLVILGAKQFADEKIQYFMIGYYVAIHHNLVLWIWKRLGIEKKTAEPA